MSHLEDFVFFSHHVPSIQDRMSPLYIPPLSLCFAYRKKTKQFTVGTGQNFSFFLQQLSLTRLVRSSPCYTDTDSHTQAVTVTRSGSSGVSPRWQPALQGTRSAGSTSPAASAGTSGSLALAPSTLAPSALARPNRPHELQTGLSIAPFPQKCHHCSHTESRFSTTSSLHQWFHKTHTAPFTSKVAFLMYKFKPQLSS